MDDVVVGRLSPDEAFDLVGHEMRLRILQVLDGADGPLGFSELRDRVGVRDSGQFNYHLRKLADRFVTDDGDGYVLTDAGRRIVGAVISGAYTKGFDADPVALDGACIDCGGSLELRFGDDTLAVTCRECGMDVTRSDVPPGVLEGHPREDAPELVDRWLKRLQASIDYRLCHNCDGTVERRLLLADEEDAPDWLAESDWDGVVRYDCTRCGTSGHSAASAAVLLRPPVVGFCHEHGVDVATTPLWELEWLEVGLERVVSEDPVRVEVPVALDDETLVVVLGREAEVVETYRE